MVTDITKSAIKDHIRATCMSRIRPANKKFILIFIVTVNSNLPRAMDELSQKPPIEVDPMYIYRTTVDDRYEFHSKNPNSTLFYDNEISVINGLDYSYFVHKSGSKIKAMIKAWALAHNKPPVIHKFHVKDISTDIKSLLLSRAVRACHGFPRCEAEYYRVFQESSDMTHIDISEEIMKIVQLGIHGYVYMNHLNKLRNIEEH